MLMNGFNHSVREVRGQRGLLLGGRDELTGYGVDFGFHLEVSE